MSRKNIQAGRQEPFSLVVLGSLASKSNSRRLIWRKGKPAFVKSPAAFSFLNDFANQCPTLDPVFTEDVVLEADIYYPSRRSDLDDSLLMDALQGKVIENDRQIKRRDIRWGLDPLNPRVELMVRLAELPDYAGLDNLMRTSR